MQPTKKDKIEVGKKNADLDLTQVGTSIPSWVFFRSILLQANRRALPGGAKPNIFHKNVGHQVLPKRPRL